MRRWTRKAIGWTTMGVLALMFGLWREDYQVVALGIVMALFLLVAYARRAPTIIARRRPSHLRVLEGDMYDMGFSVGAEGGWADVVEVNDSVPGYMRLGEGSNHMVLPLYKGEMRRPAYSLECPLRGAYRIGPMDLRASDAPGFFDKEFSVRDTHEVDVVPLYVELRSLDLTSRALKYNMGPVTVNELGRSTDFYSIRQYIKGDPYRKINWKASARYRKLMINEDEKETLSDCAIFVDSRSLAATGTPLENLHELALRSTLGLSRTLVAGKNRVMVVTYNDSVNIVPPGLGSAHNRVVQAMLVETVAQGSLTFDWAAGYARPFLKPRSDVVVFSPLVSDMTFYPAILGLIRSGHRVVVVTSPIEDFEELATDAPGARALLTGLQRTTNVAELESAGVNVIEADPDEPQLSIMVRVSAALGGERLDVAALEEEEAEELPELIDVPVYSRFGPMPEELQDEVLGVKPRYPLLALLQGLAIAALVGVCVGNWYINSDIWETINEGSGAVIINGSTYALLIMSGLFVGWVLNMLLGYLKYVRESGDSSTLVYVAYAAILLMLLWHIGALLWELGSVAGFRAFIWNAIIFVPIVGSLAVFRRLFAPAVFIIAFLMVIGLIYPNPMDDGWPSLAMALCALAYVELSWGVERFDRLYTLAGPHMTEDRGMALLRETMHRYYLVGAISMAFATLGGIIITFLPTWSQADPGPGVLHAIEAGGVFAPVSLLMWLVVLAVIGRWTVISAMGTKWGRRVVDALRSRLLLPGTGRRERAPEKEEAPPAPSGWDEEPPIPETPVIVEV